MKGFSKRLLSMLLSAAMVFGLSGITALAEETDAEETETVADTEAYDVKYAVTIWGIDQDKDEKGRTLGLTFGPATGADYTNSYVAHLDESEYDPDNGQFCIHWMTWEEIARQSRIDPTVFQACLEAGCTHSVNIVLNDELLDTSYTGEMDDGDGAGLLRYSIQEKRRYWNKDDSSTWGYPGSQVRGVLVGKDEWSKSSNTNMLDEDTCLFSCFPEELQYEIVAKAVKSDADYTSLLESDSEITYDKLWLFSGKEVYAESGTYYDPVIRPAEGELYQRSELLGITTNDHDALQNYLENGVTGHWWTRSMTQLSNKEVYLITSNAAPIPYVTNQYNVGLAPGFCLSGPADLTELDAAIEAAKALDEEAYTEASWTVLKEALDVAYEIRGTEAVRQSEVDEATLALQDAIDNLVIKADKTALGEVIEEANALNREYYTDASWAVLMEALTNAQAVYDDVNVSQEETDAAQAELEDAIANLVSVADKTALENAIATAQELEQDKASYTTASWSAVETALAAAQEVDADRDVTQEEVDEATDALISAIAYLVKNDGQSVDKSELLQLYDQARALSESDYTTDSWNELQTAVADAQAVLLNVNAAQEDVEKALDELQSALDVLVSAADKTALIAVVEEAYALNEGDYTPSSWNVLEEALAEAETVLSDGNAVQKDVEEALDVLQNALAGLVERADKSDLEAAIEAAVALEESKDDYTTDSWEALVTALAAAQAIDGDAEALQDEVDEATIALVTAAAELEFVVQTGEKTDKGELLSAYLEAMGLTESDYSTDTWASLAEAISYAQNVLMDPYTTSEEVKDALNKLQTAMGNLKAPDAAAFAIYSADDDSLTFYAEGDGTFPKEGGTYHEKEATAVYRKVDSLSATGTGDIPWYELGEDVKTVEIDSSFEQVQPASLAYWFYNYQVPAISGLEYINTSEVRSLQNTFYGCSTLDVLDVTNWDTSSVTNMYGAFNGCNSLVNIDLSGWNVSNVWTMYRLFYDCQSLTSVGDLSDWDTAANTSMYGMFYNCSALTSLGDLSGWDTAASTNMYGMFYNCSALTSVGDLSDWDTAANTSMYGMFYNCSALTSLGDLSDWNTAKVTTMQYTFRDCSALTSVGNLSDWDTAKVTAMQQMFCNCTSLTNVDVSAWNTAQVTDMSNMFRNCSSFTSLDLSGWDTTKVENYTDFAIGCTALEWVKIGEKTTIFTLGQCVSQRNWYDSPESGALVSSNYLQDVTEPGQYWTYTTEIPEAFAVYSAQDDSLTFYKDFAPTEGEPYQGKEATVVYKGVDSLAATGTGGIPWYEIRESVTSVVIDSSFAEVQPVSLAYWFYGFENAVFSGVENMDTSEVTSMRGMFTNCYALDSLDLSKWNTAKVTNMSSLFYDCEALTSIGDLSDWNTSSNTTMYCMFYKCSALTSVDVSKWDTSKVTDMNRLFYECESLTSIGDLSGWDTSSNTTMYGMFYDCSNLMSVGDLSNWDTANVTTMQYTFRDCSKLTDLGDLSGWNTEKVTTLQQTFYNCNSLTGMDVSGWNTANVTDMSYTFGNCSSFTSLDLSGWDTSSVTTNTNFATGCSALEWVAIGENTNIFRLGQCISQKTWYEAPDSSTLVSKNYLQDVIEPGKYWTYTNAELPEAFAVYSAQDDSLTFYNDFIPTEGDTYKDKIATTVYTEVDKLAATGTGGIPWYDLRDSVTSVMIDASFADAEPISLAYWFSGYANASFDGFAYMDTSNVTTIRSMFEGCSALTSLDLSEWNTSKVTTMYRLFYDCPSLLSVGDLSGWDTAANTNMYGMFYNCSALTSVGDLSDWDTAKVTNMQYTFRDCSALTGVGDLSDWDTAKVTTLQQMFYNCTSLTNVDVSDWDTAQVTDMSNTFRNCSSITTLDISGWDTTNVTSGSYFAYGCTALEWVKIGEKTTIFTLGRSVSQQNWYDRSYNGTLVSSSYLQDVTEPGQYWTYTELYTADKSELQAEYDADSQLNEVDYTASSWEPFAEALAAAKAVLDDSNASGEAIGTALIDLENARNGLVEVCDKTALEEEYNADILLREEDYTPATWAPFAEALAAAKDVIDNANATQTQVNEALSALQPAKEGLVKAAGKAELDAVIAEAKTLKQDSYTEDSWAVFEKALAAAEAVADDANATQSEVDEALEVLESAMNGLVEATDKSNLKDVLETVEAEALDGADYTAESWALFEDALKEAQDVVNNPDATQDDVDDATVALVSAVAGLKHADSTVADADKTSLLDEYVEDLTLSGSGYTADSWAAYEEALSTAQGVLLDPNASQDAVNTALDALQTARSNLKEAPKVSGVTVTAPNSTKTYDGNGITLTATAEVSPDTAEISCQWYKDGTAISGAIGSSYTIGGNVSDSGTYKCVVTATSGSESASAEGTISITINAAAQSISYATTTVSKTVGDAAFTNTLTQTTVSTESGAGISYKSSNTSVATVDGNGKVTILSDGTTTITATAAATANYKEATASYTLKVASNKNGLYKIKSGEWGYYKNGEVDKDYTGFASNSNGDWYVVNGYIHFDQNTVAKDATGALGSKGTWYYVIGSEVQHNFTGLANYKNSNGWWYIKKGEVDFTHNGVDKNKNGWWYVTGGKVQLDYTGVANYKNSSGWWYIQAGKVDFSANTVAKNKNGWWYVTGGKVQFGYTGVANYKNSNGWWYIQAGKVNFNFNGIASNKNGTWYVRGGKVQLSYNGTVTYRNRTYTIRNGRAG